MRRTQTPLPQISAAYAGRKAWIWERVGVHRNEVPAGQVTSSALMPPCGV